MCFQNPNLQARITTEAAIKAKPHQTALSTSLTTAQQFSLMHLPQALDSLLDLLVGFVGSLQRASHSFVGRPDDPFNFSLTHLRNLSTIYIHPCSSLPHK